MPAWPFVFYLYERKIGTLERPLLGAKRTFDQAPTSLSSSIFEAISREDLASNQKNTTAICG
jgi:hypothetical protein